MKCSKLYMRIYTVSKKLYRLCFKHNFVKRNSILMIFSLLLLPVICTQMWS